MQASQPPESSGEVRSSEDSGGPTSGQATATTAHTHNWGFGAFFLAEAVFVLVSVVLAATFGTLDAESNSLGLALSLVLVLPTVLAGMVAIGATLIRGHGPRRDFGLQWRRSDVTTGLGIGMGGLVLTAIASMLWTRWVGEDQASSAVGSLLEGIRLPPVLAVVIFLHVWLVAPLCEELLYRGLLWGAMERLRWSQLTIFVLTTAVFAIGHFEPARTVLLLVIAIPIGLARFLTGRVTASVVAHQVNNFLPALGLLLMSLGFLPA